VSIKVYKQLADTHYQLADLYTQLAAEEALADSAAGTGQPARPVAASPSAAPASFDSAEFEAVPFEEYAEANPEGSEAVCPKHRRPYKEGKFGPFCTSTSDDPAWTNARGYCRITPKNAAQYLRLRAAA